MSDLIGYPDKIWRVVAPMDLRCGIDGLSQWIQQSLGHSPCAGSAYIFRNRNGLRIKVRLWDGNGVWLCCRRLHQGHFVWPESNKACWTLTAHEWQWLIAGVDWQRLAAVAPGHLHA